MNEAGLIDKIEHADLNQLKEIYGLITNYFNGQSIEEWAFLPESHKRQIMQGLEEADAGLGIPAKDVSKKLRKKYGLSFG